MILLYKLTLYNRFVKNDSIGKVESTYYANYHYLGDVESDLFNGKIRGIDYTQKFNNTTYSHIHETITIKNLGKIYIERNGREINTNIYSDETIVIQGKGKCVTPIPSLNQINNSSLYWEAIINKSKLNFIVEVTIYA